MSRFQIGVALGAAAVYFFDPQNGEGRRRRVESLWRENRDTARQVGSGVTHAAESMRPLAGRVKHRIDRGSWSEDNGASWVPAFGGVVAATALGGTLAYFLDPQSGPARRKRVLTFVREEQGPVKEGFRSVRKAAGTVGPWARQAADEASKVAHEVRSKARA
jgi:gas vesicle protein